MRCLRLSFYLQIWLRVQNAIVQNNVLHWKIVTDAVKMKSAYSKSAAMLLIRRQTSVWQRETLLVVIAKWCLHLERWKCETSRLDGEVKIISSVLHYKTSSCHHALLKWREQSNTHRRHSTFVENAQNWAYKIKFWHYVRKWFAFDQHYKVSIQRSALFRKRRLFMLLKMVSILQLERSRRLKVGPSHLTCDMSLFAPELS